MAKKYKGIDFIIKVKDSTGTFKVLGGQRACTLNRSADTIDVTAKDSDGWQENLAGLKNWGIDTDGLIVENNEAYSILEDKFMNSETITAVIVTPTQKAFQGEAIITDFPLEAPYDDAATYSVTFTGSGKLEKVDSTSVQETKVLDAKAVEVDESEEKVDE